MCFQLDMTEDISTGSKFQKQVFCQNAQIPQFWILMDFGVMDFVQKSGCRLSTRFQNLRVT